jgi:CheY-like chemotaxis protein
MIPEGGNRMAGILVADIDELPLALKAVYLTECGFDVMTAANGDELLVQLRKGRGRLSLVVAEQDVLGQTDLSTLDWWLHKISPRAGLVITSDFRPWVSPGRKPDLYDLCTDFLVRPFSLDDLKDRVERVLLDRN